MDTRQPTLAVIGTAGRGSDARRITPEIYDAMYAETLRAIDDFGVRRLVSGGAAVADHLAVRAFLAGAADSLVLHLPAPFGNGLFRRYPRAVNDDAGTANRYHRQFSEACGIDSLSELARAIRMTKVEVHIGQGFKARNLEVAAAATHLLALTFGADVETRDFLPEDAGFSDPKAAGLKDGGTAHTFGQAWRARIKRHVSLTRLERMLGAPSMRIAP